MTTGSHVKVTDVKPNSRVNITYDVETGGAMEIKALPFVVGVLANLSGKPEAPVPSFHKDQRRRFIEIDRDNFDDVMNGVGPRLSYKVDNKLTDDGSRMGVELRFRSIEDFGPEQVVNQIEPLRKLLEVRSLLAGLLGKMDGNHELRRRLREVLADSERVIRIAMEATLDQLDINLSDTAPSVAESDQASLLDQIITEMGIGWNDWERMTSRREIGALVAELLNGTCVLSKDIEATVVNRIADIDKLLSGQLNEVFHHPEFQALEAAWRGLHYLVSQTETGPNLRFRVLNVSKPELHKDQMVAADYERSALFKMVYKGEYEIFGGSPYSVLIGDYYFGLQREDVHLLECLSSIAARAHAPFISAPAPGLLGLENFTDLPYPRDLAKKFEVPDYTKWKSFRELDDSRYVGLTLPNFLLRLPYGPDTVPVETFNFKEAVDGFDHTKYLWGNAAYVLTSRLTNAFNRYGWCAAIRGAETGGLVTGLPQHMFQTDEGDTLMKCPTEIPISDRRQRELTHLGFIALCHDKRSDRAVFFSVPSCAKAKRYDTDEANAVAKLAVRLEYTITISRFAHYLKAIMRDRIGCFYTRRDCEQYLNHWISQYVTSEDSPSEEDDARFPLGSALVEVLSGKSGVYRAIVSIRPRFQFHGLSLPLQLITELPAPAKG